MSKPDGGAAFPIERIDSEYGTRWTESGMTLRDWFAGQALTGLLAERSLAAPAAATRAYEYADAMIAERESES